MIRSVSIRRQNGIALIMVLLAMALVVLLSSGMTREQSLRVFRASHLLGQQQGYSVALGAEEFAKQILFRDYEDDKDGDALADSPDEEWSQYAAILPLDDNGVIEVQVDDLSGRINLNDLVAADGSVDEVTRGRVERLLQIVEVSSISVDALIDWIDSNDEAISARGAEDGVYLLQDPSYRAANQYFTSVSELRLIDGMTGDDYWKLSPYVAALPVSGLGINVNMAPAPVIQALHEKLTQADAGAILEGIEEERFENVQDFLALSQFAGLGLKATGLGVRSYFFEVASRVTVDNRQVNLVSLLYRGPDGALDVVARDSGQKNRITKKPFTVSEDQ
ncbi:type II secretion system minor pseudopilin GspK [Marinobacter mobilis]|uniref:type II secretion system minor pseudopilin GspK n=1 Tax=Marinobacter mobilis TaxID=488533 RepID=UPI0035C6ABB8